MAIYNVIEEPSITQKGVTLFYVQGYPTGRSSSVEETRRTFSREEAEEWAARRNAGLPATGKEHWAMYADD